MNKEKIEICSEKILCIIMGLLFCLGLFIMGLRGRRIVLVGIVCLFSVIINLQKLNRDKDYTKKVLGIKKNSNWDYRYDWLRVLAVIMVIVTHAIQVDISLGLVTGERKTYVFTVLYVFCLACNLIYVMLSGALLIPYKEEEIKDFYLKRVNKVVFPMAVYFVFYLWQNRELEGHITGQTIKNIFERLCQGNTPESPHYWLMYTLLSVYIAIPLFRYMFKDMPYKMISAVVLISVILMTINLFSPIKFGFGSFISGWEGVAIIGYWVTRPETKKYYWLLIGMGTASFGIMVMMILKQMDYLTLCCNTSPIMVLISVGIFALVFKFEKIFAKGNIALAVLGKYSYSLILIHWWTLHWITRGRCNIRVEQNHGGGLFFSLFVTLAVSLMLAVLIDNYVLTFVEQIWNWLIRGVHKLTSIIGGNTKETKKIEASKNC